MSKESKIFRKLVCNCQKYLFLLAFFFLVYNLVGDLLLINMAANTIKHFFHWGCI